MSNAETGVGRKRVLIIAYYFPPSGGSGVQRALKFVKYLPAYDWQPVVLTLDPDQAAYPDLDPGMLADVPTDVEVIRTGSWDPYRIYAGLSRKSKEDAVSVGFLSDAPITFRERVARWVRANVFIPDARVGWYFYALKKAKELVEAGKIDVVFTTGPPHSTHLIGRTLKRRYNIPWVADFRDPWSDIDFLEELPMSKFSRHLNASLEQSVLDEASAVLTISPAMQRKYTAKTRTRCKTIFNGFDEEDFEMPASTETDHFYIAHVGNMNAARNPEILWRMLAGNHDAFPKLRIRLVGNVDGQVIKSLQDANLMDRVERLEYCPHSEAVQQMKESALLLLPINRVFSARGIVTGKLFEYLATGNPILGIGPIDGDAAAILDETGAGKMIDYEDEAGLRDFLNDTYQNWNTSNQAMSADGSAITQYSRKGQTGHLAGLLNELISNA